MNESKLTHILSAHNALLQAMSSFAPQSMKSTIKHQIERIQADINSLKRPKGKDFSGDSQYREKHGMFQAKEGR